MFRVVLHRGIYRGSPVVIIQVGILRLIAGYLFWWIIKELWYPFNFKISKSIGTLNYTKAKEQYEKSKSFGSKIRSILSPFHNYIIPDLFYKAAQDKEQLFREAFRKIF